jgi:hypothetical protein
MRRILAAKATQRWALAQLPFAEKFRLVFEMHHLAEQARGGRVISPEASASSEVVEGVDISGEAPPQQ